MRGGSIRGVNEQKNHLLFWKKTSYQLPKALKSLQNSQNSQNFLKFPNPSKLFSQKFFALAVFGSDCVTPLGLNLLDRNFTELLVGPLPCHPVISDSNFLQLMITTRGVITTLFFQARRRVHPAFLSQKKLIRLRLIQKNIFTLLSASVTLFPSYAFSF